MLCYVAIIHTGGRHECYAMLPLYILVAHMTYAVLPLYILVAHMTYAVLPLYILVANMSVMLCVAIIHTGGPHDYAVCCNYTYWWSI